MLDDKTGITPGAELELVCRCGCRFATRKGLVKHQKDGCPVMRIARLDGTPTKARGTLCLNERSIILRPNLTASTPCEELRFDHEYHDSREQEVREPILPEETKTRTGFFDTFLARVEGTIYARYKPGMVFTVAGLRRGLGIPGSDRSSISFLAKAMTRLVDRGLIKRLRSRTYRVTGEIDE
ncbi:MAG: hypothetical protein Q6365_016435 [Candidatus Sigynarchaeota archaeon]